MSDLELALAARIIGIVPARLKVVEEFRGPVFFFDPDAGFSPISYLQENVYSLTCQTEVRRPYRGLGKKPIIINDLRICEIALDLIAAAIQDTHEAQSDIVYMTVSRLVLEQSLPFPSPTFQAGLYLDRLNAEALDETLRRRHKFEFATLDDAEIRYHLEQIVQFILAHEVTHYCLFADQRFRLGWLSSIRSTLDRLETVLSAPREGGLADDHFIRSAILARQEDLRDCADGDLNRFPDLEELICDFAGVIGLVHALDRLGSLKGNIKDLMLSVWAGISAVWLVAMIRSTVEDLLCYGYADMRPAASQLLSRGSLTLLYLGQVAAQASALDEEAARQAVIEAWRLQPDYESMILGAVNAVFSPENLERLVIMGSAATSDGLCDAQSVAAAIRRHFGWSA